MEERERRVLDKLRKSLVSDIADVEPVLDHLISSGVFTANDDHVQRIRAGETARSRARRLLDTLPQCGRRAAFGHFVDALRPVRPHLAERLESSLAESLKDECPMDTAPAHHGPPRLSDPTARELQEALRAFHKNQAECLPVFDFQSCAQAAGLEQVFVTLSAVDFSESQASFHRQKSLSVEQVRELTSKTWCERAGDSAVAVTDLGRLL